MNVFIIGTPLETAKALDKRRLNKQIIECHQILDALDGKKAWSNHPCVLQYKCYSFWLYNYMVCLERFRDGDISCAVAINDVCCLSLVKPPFHTEEYFTQIKRRLYTKNNLFYKQWAYLGESQQNWYFVDGEWRVYENGKRLK